MHWQVFYTFSPTCVFIYVWLGRTISTLCNGFSPIYVKMFWVGCQLTERFVTKCAFMWLLSVCVLMCGRLPDTFKYFIPRVDSYVFSDVCYFLVPFVCAWQGDQILWLTYIRLISIFIKDLFLVANFSYEMKPQIFYIYHFETSEKKLMSIVFFADLFF